jgi:Family of unknown function (DUF6635)
MPSSGELTVEEARRLVERAARKYFDDRRARIDAFVDRHFSLAGSASIHRNAIGWDLLKAPANIFLAVPNLTMRLAAAGARLAGARSVAQRLARSNLFLTTAVGREVEWLIITELLELPHRQGGRESRKDALAETILAAPEIEALVSEALEAVGRRGDDPEFRDRLESAMTAYVGTRAAASEITTAMITLGAGALAVKQMTPGMISLGPALAAAIAQQAAVASFPLGATLGGIWYGIFPVAASPALIAGLTSGMMAVAAIAATFAGILADPIQQRLGLHQRRLERLVDTLERQICQGDGEAGFVARDQYVARLLDFVDLLGSAYRIARS